MPRKSLVFRPKRGKNTERSIAKDHFSLDLRTKDQSNVKVYDQKKTVDYADYKVGLFYISAFDLFIVGEPVISKLEKKRPSSPSK